MFKQISRGLAALGAADAGAYALIPHPKMESIRAITIQAQPTDIWPWLAQIGLGRGGLYSNIL